MKDKTNENRPSTIISIISNIIRNQENFGTSVKLKEIDTSSRQMQVLRV